VLFEIINAILTPNAPKTTIKIGLNYLAQTLHFNQEYTETYLKILLSAPETIRSSCLEVNPIPGQEDEAYVYGANTEKYRTFGAPLYWNSLYVAQAMERRIQEQQLEQLEWAHLEIVDACLQQDFNDQELEAWVEIFASLKSYVLPRPPREGLRSDRRSSFKKFLCHQGMQERVLQLSTDNFLKTLQLLYLPDVEESCKDQVLSLLESLHDAPDRSTPQLKEFVY